MRALPIYWLSPFLIFMRGRGRRGHLNNFRGSRVPVWNGGLGQIAFFDRNPSFFTIRAFERAKSPLKRKYFLVGGASGRAAGGWSENRLEWNSRFDAANPHINYFRLLLLPIVNSCRWLLRWRLWKPTLAEMCHRVEISVLFPFNGSFVEGIITRRKRIPIFACFSISVFLFFLLLLNTDYCSNLFWLSRDCFCFYFDSGKYCRTIGRNNINKTK